MAKRRAQHGDAAHCSTRTTRRDIRRLDGKRLVLEVKAFLQIFDQDRPPRLPAKELPGQGARRRVVKLYEGVEEAEEGA